MSIVYRIDPERGATVVLWDGSVTPEEFLAHVRAMTADPGWPPPGRLHLTDLRTAQTDDAFDAAVFREAAELFGGVPDGIATMRIAVVAGESFRKAREFEAIIADFRPSFIVFNALDTACTWLQLEVAEVAAILEELRGEIGGKEG